MIMPDNLLPIQSFRMDYRLARGAMWFYRLVCGRIDRTNDHVATLAVAMRDKRVDR